VRTENSIKEKEEAQILKNNVSGRRARRALLWGARGAGVQEWRARSVRSSFLGQWRKQLFKTLLLLFLKLLLCADAICQLV